MKTLWLYILTFLIVGRIDAQELQGTVLGDNREPIPYVSIGIIGKNNGTISNLDGSFKIDLSNTNDTDILRFSSIGFETKDYTISKINNYPIEIILREKTYVLNEVVIRNGINTYEFGNKKIHNGAWGFGSMKHGFEIAQLFRNKKTIILDKFGFHLRSCGYDSLLFRINIYTNNKGKVGEIINKAPIYVQTDKDSGWISKKLAKYKIFIKSDFFVAVEGIKGWNSMIKPTLEDVDVALSGNTWIPIPIAKTYFRFSSHAKWSKTDIKMDFYLKAIGP